MDAKDKMDNPCKIIENMNECEILLLANQICFSLYVSSKELIKRYKPLLDPYSLTYTGYIILMALWEKDNITIKELGKRLYLDSGTLTPILKKLETQNYIKRIRSSSDERNIFIKLNQRGNDLQKEAIHIQMGLFGTLNFDPIHRVGLLKGLHKLMDTLESGEEQPTS